MRNMLVDSGYFNQVRIGWIHVSTNQLKWLISLSYLFANLGNTKLSTMPTLCITGKLECFDAKYPQKLVMSFCLHKVPNFVCFTQKCGVEIFVAVKS